MWHDYTTLADQRLTEMYEDAAVRRSIPPKDRRPFPLREVLGHALMRWGERLAGPARSPIAHR